MTTYATNTNLLTAPCAMRVIYRLSGNAGFASRLGGFSNNSGTTFDLAMFDNGGSPFTSPNVKSSNVRYGPLTQGAWTGISNVAIKDVAAGESIGYILKYNIPANPTYSYTTPDISGAKNVYINSTMIISFET